MKYKARIEAWLQSVIRKEIANTDIEGRVGKEIEKLRYDYLPHGACWLCSMPVSRSRGYYMWTGKMFCTETCLKKYAQLIQKPDGSGKYLHGQLVEEFKPLVK